VQIIKIRVNINRKLTFMTQLKNSVAFPATRDAGNNQHDGEVGDVVVTCA